MEQRSPFTITLCPPAATRACTRARLAASDAIPSGPAQRAASRQRSRGQPRQQTRCIKRNCSALHRLEALIYQKDITFLQMYLNDLLKSRREEILKIAANHGARNVRVFGSVARGEADAQSDIDLLVEFKRGTTLLGHAALIHDLEDLLGVKVDVVSEHGLRERVRDRVLGEAVAL